MYWVEYRPLKKQWLGKTNKVGLHNGQVLLAKSLHNTHGNINTVILSRADNSNQYITSLIKFYVLKVRENVIE